MTSHHHLTIPPPSHNIENECVRSFSSFYITTTFPLPKLSTHAQFWWWLIVPCHHHPTTTPTLSKSSTHARFWQCGWLFFVTTLEIKHACSFSMVVVCFLSPPSHHPRNWAYQLMFFIVNIIIKCFFVVIIIIKYFVIIIQWFKWETRG